MRLKKLINPQSPKLDPNLHRLVKIKVKLATSQCNLTHFVTFQKKKKTIACLQLPAYSAIDCSGK